MFSCEEIKIVFVQALLIRRGLNCLFVFTIIDPLRFISYRTETASESYNRQSVLP